MIPDFQRWSPATRQAVRSSLTKWLVSLKQRPDAAAPIVVDCGARHGWYRLTVSEAEELVSALAGRDRIPEKEDAS